MLIEVYSAIPVELTQPDSYRIEKEAVPITILRSCMSIRVDSIPLIVVKNQFKFHPL